MAFRNLGRPPRTKETYVWADYGELLCLDSSDRMSTVDDLFDIVHDLRDERDGDDSPEDADDDDATALGPDERRVAWASDLVNHWAFRARMFGEHYPFTVAGGVLRAKLGQRTAAQRLYLFLLLAGSGRYLARPAHSRLTRTFEEVSLQALKQYLPPSATAGLFHRGLYIGNLFKKIESLASDLGETCTAKAQDFKRRNVGDGGLDVVAWVRFPGDDDLGRGFLTVFGQCACSPEDWESKQTSVDDREWRKRIDLQVSPQPVLFIPFCYRAADGSWPSREGLRPNTVLVDRVRIMRLLDPAGADAAGLADVETLAPTAA